jgi:CRISPR-associated protein Cmr3
MTTATTTQRIGLCLEPLDVLFFRDGRPFGAATRASSGEPMPQTLTGALRTALLALQGFSFENLAARLRRNKGEGREEPIEQALKECGAPEWIVNARVRGPFLARLGDKGNVADVLVPVPAVLHGPKDEACSATVQPLHRLAPLKAGGLPGWRGTAPGWGGTLRPLWLSQVKPMEPVKGYLNRAGLATFLSGRDLTSTAVTRAMDLFGFDNRTGIEIVADQLTAKQGGIYGATFLALRPGYMPPDARQPDEKPYAVVLYAELVFPNGTPPGQAVLHGIDTLPLGGEGRRVAVRVQESAWKWPDAKPSGPRQKPLLVLTTPGLFGAQWRPEALKDCLVAAAVPAAVAVSGWDLARGGPKPNRFAAAAGSVYFLDSLPDNLPDALSDRDEDRAQGWGCYVKGVWTDE